MKIAMHLHPHHAFCGQLPEAALSGEEQGVDKIFARKNAVAWRDALHSHG